MAEDFGGDTMFVDISAKNGTNIEALGGGADRRRGAGPAGQPDMEAQGVAIEAHLDRGRGPVATVLIQRGTLRVGDSVVAGDAYGRVRRMVDEHGEDRRKGAPSRPVQVIGFTSVPVPATTSWLSTRTASPARSRDRRSARKRNALAARSRKRISLEDLDSALKETSQLNPILKGDNAGTVEAPRGGPAGHPDRRRSGNCASSTAASAGSPRPTSTWRRPRTRSSSIQCPRRGQATELANRDGVEIRYYSVIYQAIDETREARSGYAQTRLRGGALQAEIRAIFSRQGRQHRGLPGAVGHHAPQRQGQLLRDNVVVAENLTVSLAQA